jgi:hypothetical protein
MAAGDSIVSICNIALIELGEDPIVDLAQNVKPAILCRARYDDVRRGVLRASLWSCNTAYAQLAASPTPPPFGWSQSYPLPADFLRMIKIWDNSDAKWEVVGRNLYTNEGAPLNVVYGTDLQDPSVMDPLLVQTIGYTLALDLCHPITNSNDIFDRVAKKMEGKLDIGRLTTSQENSPREWDEDVWLRSRR